MSDLHDQVRAASRGGLSIHQQIGKMIDRMLERHRLSAAVFLGADGKPTEAARIWFEALKRDNFVAEFAFDPDPRVHAKNEGRRELALDIVGSAHLDNERLDELMRKRREIEHGGR